MSNTDDFQAQLAKSTGKTVETSKSAFVSKRKAKKKEAAPSIESNPFVKIVMATSDPQAQKEAMVKLMTYVDAETTEANSKALSEYSAHMQAKRQEFSVGLMSATDTKTFSNLQSVLIDINNGVLDFEEQMAPFMEIIKAVRLIQEEDATTDILAEMREDGKTDDILEEALKDLDGQINVIRANITSKRSDINEQKELKTFFLRNIKPEAQTKINTLRSEITGFEEDLKALKAEKVALSEANKKSDSKFAHLAEAKKVMATMLNLSGDDHKERHEELVSTAINFVKTTKERVTETLGHSVKMGGQIKDLSDLAFTMRGSYSVLAESAKEAEVINSKAHEKLKVELEATENPLEKMSKEASSRDMAKHITELNDAASETTAVITDLTVSSQRIENMSAANIAQIKKTEQIQTSGIAGVADNLSSVLTSISQTAIGQASNAARQSLRRMNDNTMSLTKEGMLKAAQAQKDDNSELAKSLIQMVDLGKVIDITNDAARVALEESRELVDELEEVSNEVKASAAETLDIASDAISEEIENQ